MTFDGKSFGEEIVAAVKSHVSSTVGPLLSRLDAMEKRIADLPTPKDGKDADEDAITARVSEKMASDLTGLRSAIEAIPAPLELPELPDVAGMIEEAISAIPKSVGHSVIETMINDAVAAIPGPKNGRDTDPEEIRSMVADEVGRAVGAIPAPKDGESVTVDDVRPLIDEAASKAVSAIPTPKDGAPGKDGVGAAGAMIDRAGNLVMTFTDGTTRELGLVAGKDGAPGKNGRDGFSLSDFDADLLPDGRTVLLSFEQGDTKHSIELGFPVVLDRGVFKDGQAYETGDGVTWGGSFWIAQEDTDAKPDSGKGWRLAVKKGRDGKDKP